MAIPRPRGDASPDWPDRLRRRTDPPRERVRAVPARPTQPHPDRPATRQEGRRKRLRRTVLGFLALVDV
jgi:hypothetical protein